MILQNTIKTKSLSKGGITFNFLSSGDIFDITHEDTQINLLKGNQIDGSLMNVYLRIHQEDSILSTRLIGNHSPSTFHMDQDNAYYKGVFEGVSYQLRLILDKWTWRWAISLYSNEPKKVDIIYGQDIAIGSKASVLSSEPYTVQYIDYKAFKEDQGYTLCARQNQGATHFLQIGSLGKNISYTTDGFQFFGKSYKKSNYPEALNQKQLVSEIYQYEFSYFAIQSELLRIDEEVENYTFYGYYQPNYQGKIEKPEVITFEKISVQSFDVKPTYRYPLLSVNRQINGQMVSRKTIEMLYQNLEHLEFDQDELLSFFTQHHHHVVLMQKELLVERPHGHLMVHGDLLHVSENVMATTNFMYGIFNSHVVIGNTSFNKFLGDSRNPLNVQKTSGQRIYIKIDGIYHILGLPSYYEMGATMTKWVYVLKEDTITISSYVHINSMQQTLTITSKENKLYDIIISSQIVMGNNEYQYDIEYENVNNNLIFKAPKQSMMHDKYPDITYSMHINQPYQIIDSKQAFHIDDDMGMLLISFKQQNCIRIDLSASIAKEQESISLITLEQADDLGTRYFESFLKYLDVNHPSYEPNFKQLVHLAFWYTHQALVHYASPHGLEQYNGAAWGTRDVCQGPIEFFMAAQRYDIVREILIKIYSRQFIENGDFPQWYMFDRYYQIQAHESHGDIIVWPLRTIAYYLQATHDLTILDEVVPYMSMKRNDFVEPTTVLDHIKYQIEAIKNSFVSGTNLPKYGGGDWDDTLQPANHELTEKMVSGWTVALLYEALSLFAHEIKEKDLVLSNVYLKLSSKIKADYEKYVIIDGIPAGFIIFGDEIKPLLHPKDNQTGLKYRLLPFTRAMISEMMDKNQKESYQEIINKYLKHPDGVRLMDDAILYQGGLKTYFQRGETAANFGREIGLQYVHAHIRYIEAMAKTGYKDEAYKALFEVNPILIQKAVPHALPRQSNMYFSSSDANFKNRYDAKKYFDDIRYGKVGVKGGWRLYSSGPGIYIKQLITNIFGIRLDHHDLVIDPIIPNRHEGLVIHYHYFGKPLVIKIHVGDQEPLFMGKKVDYQRIHNPYRKGGIKIDQSILNQYSYLDFDVWIP